MTGKRYHSVAWLRVGFLVQFQPTASSLAEYDSEDQFERVGMVQDIHCDRIRIRTVAPELKPKPRRDWEAIAFLDANPEDVRPLDNAKVFSSTKRLFARLDANCKRDVGGRRR